MVVPRGWEPAVLQKEYLRLEDARRPTLELRWRFSPGRASIEEIARAYLVRMEKSLAGLAIQDFGPPDLAPATKDYEVAPFSVEAGEMIFRGAVMLCLRCRRTAFLQVGAPRAEETLSTASRIVSSYRDHHSSGWVPWSLFDIRADLPGDFRLHSHTFQPGYFRMTFRGRGQWLTLHRWAPADVILRRIELKEWVAGQYRKEIELWGRPSSLPRGAGFRACLSGRTLVMRNFTGFPAVEIVPEEGGTFIQRLGRSLLRSARFRAMVWHNQAANRIFGVEVEGRGAANHRLLYEVAGRFKALDVGAGFTPPFMQ